MAGMHATMIARAVVLLAALSLLCGVMEGAAAPSSIITHSEGDIIAPRANAYRSRRTLTPFNYYTLPVCKPSKEVMKKEKTKEDIGEILMGNRLVPTTFQFNVANNVLCERLCIADFDAKDVHRANYMIENKYDVRMFLDSWPLVSGEVKEVDEQATFHRGFPLGAVVSGEGGNEQRLILYNHFDFTIRYRKTASGGIDLTGFHVTPHSFEQVTVCDAATFTQGEKKSLKLPLSTMRKGIKVPYTYSVVWEESSDDFKIAHTGEEDLQKRGHKVAAVYGVLLALLTGVVVAFVMLRTVRKDLAVYLDDELQPAEQREETGWKLVRGDVFRTPPYAAVLSTLVGAGAQVAATVFLTMLLCAFRLVDPGLRGHFLTAIIIVFLFMHAVSGFVVSRMLKLFGWGSWRMAMSCVVAFPCALGGGVMVLDLIHIVLRTTISIPLTSLIAMVFAWVLISLPFGAMGVMAGVQMETIAVTAKVSSIPRLIPQEADGKTLYYVVLGSVLPFIACCVEIAFVLNAFWREEHMYMYGLLTFFLCILAVLCTEVGVIVTYFTLRDEDYRWWWRSFASLAMSGLYVFAYSIFFLKHSLKIRLVSSIFLFLSYMLGISIMFGLALGSFSFFGSFWLVQHMYAAIKAD